MDLRSSVVVVSDHAAGMRAQVSHWSRAAGGAWSPSGSKCVSDALSPMVGEAAVAQLLDDVVWQAAKDLDGVDAPYVLV